jgi:heme-degrading monooxygenase HmoA
MPELIRLAGYRGALVLRRRVEGGTELEVLTFWTSMAAIRRFAGDIIDRAVVEPAAKAVLTRFDSRVRHFDVVLDALNKWPPDTD